MDYSNVKYLHALRLGDPEIEDFLDGDGPFYVFPKLDGTNAVVWADEDGAVHAGSRNRELSIDNDNCGFYNWLLSENGKEVCDMAVKSQGCVLYGEWLGAPGAKQPGSIKSYVKQGFFLFDVKCLQTGAYVPFEQYKCMADKCGVQCVEPLAVLSAEEVSEGRITVLAEGNCFNLPNGRVGEGVVVKNYGYRSKYGNYEVAKLVRQEYKDGKSKKDMPENVDEKAVINDLVCDNDVWKTVAKAEAHFKREFSCTDRAMVGFMFGNVWGDFLTEEMRVVAKKYGHVPLKFDTLKKECDGKVRKVLGL